MGLGAERLGGERPLVDCAGDGENGRWLVVLGDGENGRLVS